MFDVTPIDNFQYQSQCIVTDNITVRSMKIGTNYWWYFVSENWQYRYSFLCRVALPMHSLNKSPQTEQEN
jgi:hypothetical protein